MYGKVGISTIYPAGGKGKTARVHARAYSPYPAAPIGAKKGEETAKPEQIRTDKRRTEKRRGRVGRRKCGRISPHRGTGETAAEPADNRPRRRATSGGRDCGNQPRRAVSYSRQWSGAKRPDIGGRPSLRGKIEGKNYDKGIKD